MRKLILRGIYLKSVLATEDFRVIEAYLGGAQDVLGIPRKQHGVEKLKEGLEKLGIKGLSSQMSHHELNAATCAYVGKLLLDGKAVIYGASNEVLLCLRIIENQNNHCGLQKILKKENQSLRLPILLYFVF